MTSLPTNPNAYIRAQSDKVTASKNMLHNANTSQQTTKVGNCVDTVNNLVKVDIGGGSGSHGLATEAKQDDQITKLTEIDAVLDTMNGKFTVGSDDSLETAQQVCIYGRKDPAVSGLRALKVQDDGKLETSDPALNAKITSGNDDSITGDLQQNLIYGRFDNDGTLKAMKTSSDGSVITSPAGGTIITTDGTTSEQRVMILANSGGNLRTVLCDGNGALIVDNSADSIITADGVTKEQRVMLNGNHNGNLRTVKVGEDGAVAIELDYSWDNTTTIFSAQTIADGASATSSTFDLGQGISHDPGAVEFFHTNSASVQIDITAEVSPDGTNWYALDGVSFSSTKQYVSHNQEEVGISIGHRYMRLVVTNNDGLGTSTNITTRVAFYK